MQVVPKLEPAPAHLPALIVSRPGAPTRELPLLERTTVVGRDPHLEACLADVTVSRCHAAFVVQGARVWVSDLGARNGVLVNGVRIEVATPVRLRAGDRLRIGKLELEYRAPTPEASAPPAGPARGREPGRPSGRGP